MSSNDSDGGSKNSKRKSLKLAINNHAGSLFKKISALNNKKGHEDDEDSIWQSILSESPPSVGCSPSKKGVPNSSSHQTLASLIPTAEPPSPRNALGRKSGSHTSFTITHSAPSTDASSEDSPHSTPSSTPPQASPVSATFHTSNDSHHMRSPSDDNIKTRVRGHTASLSKSSSAVHSSTIETLNPLYGATFLSSISATSAAASAASSAVSSAVSSAAAAAINILQSPRGVPFVVTEIIEDGIILLTEQNGYQRVRGGTLEKLVEKLTSDKFLDPNYLIEFLLTYRSFTTSRKLLSLLTERYNITPPTEHDAEQMDKYVKTVLAPIRFRTLNVIRRWVSEQPKDFTEDTELRANLLSFLEVVAQTGNDKLASTIRNALDKKMSNAVEDIEVISKIPTPRLPSGFSSGDYKLIDVAPEEIARQLTLIERTKFLSVDVTRECINQTWTKRESEAKYLNSTIEWFNKVSQWVCSEVVKQNKMDSRVKILEHMIAIAESFLSLNNINGVMEVISGLSKNPVHRLKGTWREISTKSLKTFTRLDKLVSAENNYNEMRTHIKSLTPPCIPYLGLFLRDIVFIEDGNSDELLDSSYINFEKRSMLGQVFRQIIEYQKTPYSLEAVEKLQQFLIALVNEGLPEEELYHLSLEIVPRGGFTKGKKQKHDIEREREREKEKSEREREKSEIKEKRQSVAFTSSTSNSPYSKHKWKRDSMNSPADNSNSDTTDRNDHPDDFDERISAIVEAKLKTKLDAQSAALQAQLNTLVSAQISELVDARLKTMVDAAIFTRLSSVDQPIMPSIPQTGSYIHSPSKSSLRPSLQLGSPRLPSPRSTRTTFALSAEQSAGSNAVSPPISSNPLSLPINSNPLSLSADAANLVALTPSDRNLTEQIDCLVQASVDKHYESAKQELDAKLTILHKQNVMMMDMWNGIVQLRHYVPESEFRKLLGLAQEMRKLSLPP